MESLENRQRRNNIRLKNLKEKAEGADLQEYLTDVFESMMGSDITDKIKIRICFQIGVVRKNATGPEIY